LSSNGAGSRSHQFFAEPEESLDSDDPAGRGYFIPDLLLGVVSERFALAWGKRIFPEGLTEGSQA
jgi:hypothetical protein